MWNRTIAVMQVSVCPFLQLEKPEDELIQYSGELLVSARLSVPAQYTNFQFEGIKCFTYMNPLARKELRSMKD